MSELPKLAAQAAQLMHTAMETPPTPAGAAAQPAAPAPAPTAPAAAAAPAPAAPAPSPAAPAATAPAAQSDQPAAPAAAAPTAPAAAAPTAPAAAPAPAAPAPAQQAPTDAALRAELDKANGRISELEAQLKETQTLLQQSKAQHAALVGHVMTDTAGPGSWPDAIKACDGDVSKALRSFPALAKEFRAAYGAKKPTV